MSENPTARTISQRPGRGDLVELRVERLAHGGEGIAELDGRVVFVAGAWPGDTVTARLTQVKKSFARGQLIDVVVPGDLRVESTCPAAAAGAGCCDFATLDPAKETVLKEGVLVDQLRRIGKLESLPEAELIDVEPHRGWRTRVRLGVDAEGRAGLRKRGSHDLVIDVACTQLVPGLVDGLVGPNARRFTPGAEVVAVLDSTGQRHVVETRKAPRGRRVEHIEEALEGSGTVVERADGREFRFPATAFWQAHVHAPDTYTELVRRWLAEGSGTATETGPKPGVGWDLYGGVGVFVPALADAVGGEVVSVDYSPAATAAEQLSLKDYDVRVVSDRVERVAAQLPKPAAVVLDPPRAGAGADVVATVAAAAPGCVIHVGCDPATFARDLAAWEQGGYAIERLAVINAFPGTHHMEAVALLLPALGAQS